MSRGGGRLCVRELTPRGAGAVSVIALSGPGALARASALVRGRAPRPGELRLVHLAAGGEELDEALLVCASAEDVELHLHGSAPLVARVLALLGAEAAPATPAEEPELEARAAALLADAASESGARILLDQAEGALRRELEALARARGADFDARLAELVERGRCAAFALEPARIVIAGPVNAGKSTLFNLLLGERRAIVSGVPGTTRDVVRARAQLGRYPVELADTAGEGEPTSDAARAVVERAGQALARGARATADLVLWLSPAGRPAPAPAGASVLALLAHADEASAAELAAAAAAIAPLADPRAAVARIEAEFHRGFRLPAEPWSPGRAAPFDARSRQALAGLAAAPEAERGRLLEELLARGD